MIKLRQAHEEPQSFQGILEDMRLFEYKALEWDGKEVILYREPGGEPFCVREYLPESETKKFFEDIYDTVLDWPKFTLELK